MSVAIIILYEVVVVYEYYNLYHVNDKTSGGKRRLRIQVFLADELCPYLGR